MLAVAGEFEDLVFDGEFSYDRVVKPLGAEGALMDVMLGPPLPEPGAGGGELADEFLGIGIVGSPPGVEAEAFDRVACLLLPVEEKVSGFVGEEHPAGVVAFA